MPRSEGVRAPDSSGRVPTFFGELTRAVALETPVSHAALWGALDRLGDEPPAHRPVASVSVGTVHVVSADAWHRRATSLDLRPADELAAREVHRRMASALGAPAIPPRADPFVVPE